MLFTITVLGYLHQQGAWSDSKLITEFKEIFAEYYVASAFYIRRCPICFMQNINQTGLMVLEKKSFEWFLPYMLHGGHLEFRIMVLLDRSCITIM